MTTLRCSSGWAAHGLARALLVAGCLLASTPAIAQGDAQAASWSKVESTEAAKKYFDRIKKGEFDAESKAFLEQVALPQLAVEGNRRQIERIRRRMRDMLLNEKTSEASALDAAAKTAVGWLASQAGNPQVEPLVRVNAMLLIGELRGKDGRPWSGAIGPLAAAMGDGKLPAGVRVAAAAGLARHVDGARAAGSADATLAPVAAPLVAVIAAPPSTADGAAGDWLVSRALDMLPIVAPQATPEAGRGLLAILSDATRAVDVRVRAAAALGATATAASNVDAGEAVSRIRSLAAEALKADITTAAERALTARISGQPLMPMAPAGFEGAGPGFPGAPGEFGGMPGGGTTTVDDPIDELVVRRDAWRLMTLATAVATADGAAGLSALLAGDAAARSKAIAQTLRESALALDRSLDAASMKQAYAAIERLGGIAGAAAPRPAAGGPAPAAEPPTGNDPFGTGN